MRKQLAEMGVDWNLPPYPTITHLDTSQPVRVEVDLGQLSGEIRRSAAIRNIEKYQDILRAKPNNAVACNSLAWLYVTGPDELRDAEKALPLAEKAVRLKPKEWIYYNTLGVVHYRLGRFETAIESLCTSAKSSGGALTAFDLFFVAMSYHRLGESHKARESYDKAVTWWESQSNLPDRWVDELESFRAEADGVLGRLAGGVKQ